MSEFPVLFLALSAGIALGAVFFGGLWWTIRKGIPSAQPALWFSGSLLLRTAIVTAGFYFVFRGDWRNLTACLVGFLAARIVVGRLTQDQAGAP